MYFGAISTATEVFPVPVADKLFGSQAGREHPCLSHLPAAALRGFYHVP